MFEVKLQTVLFLTKNLAIICEDKLFFLFNFLLVLLFQVNPFTTMMLNIVYLNSDNLAVYGYKQDSL